jgi:phosphomannomutase
MAAARSELPIRFGTGGWRGVLGEGFDLARARALAGAVAAFAAEGRPGAPVLVVHDTRFLADRVADQAAAEIQGQGVPVLRARGPVATPVACRAVRLRRCAAGLLVTASHNPPEYLGMKVVGGSGGPVSSEVARRLERDAAARLASGEASVARLASDEASVAPSRARFADLNGPYLAGLLRLLDRDALARARLRVAYDALHGAGAGVLDRALVRCGVRVALLRGESDPRFGGAAPDPTPERLAALRRALRAGSGPRLGLATDGDGDRFAAVDARGRVLSASDALALLVDHLAVTRRVRGALAISHATGSLVARVAEGHGLRVERHALGFGSLSESLAAGRATLAGDESGGFAWSRFALDKDGILAGALLAERLAVSRVPLHDALRELRRRHGPSACGRCALAISPRLAERLARLAEAPPERFDGSRVLVADASDGLRLALGDGGFALFRISGTEPALRLYAEAPSAPALRRRLRCARELLQRREG